MASTRSRVLSLMTDIAAVSRACPAHSACSSINWNLTKRQASLKPDLPDYAFEMGSSNVRYGPGVSKELAMDAVNMAAKRTLVISDKTISNLPPFKSILDSLTKLNVPFDVFDDISIEPSNESIDKAVEFGRRRDYDLFVAVGGGSVMDTCKLTNLLATYRDASLDDFVPKPYGLGRVIDEKLRPMFAVSTTAGTGSETTGVAVFTHIPHDVKVGVSGRSLRPTLGFIDPEFMRYMPSRLAAYSGFDVFCHSLESFTNISYDKRVPRPTNPKDRPMYQGRNPISDVWATHALKAISKYFRQSVKDAEDIEARSAMHLVSCFAGIGFGNAGVHLCHGMSYPISGLVKENSVPAQSVAGYPSDKPLIPHGLSVVITAPAVFQFTAPYCPERHIEVAKILDPKLEDRANGKPHKNEDAGRILADVILSYMSDLDIPNGISAFGYSSSDIPALIKGTLPQERVLRLAPKKTTEEDLQKLFEDSLVVY